ncbi:blast:Titin, partial [Drosophila guanche]
MQHVPKDTVETIASAETTELSTPKPQPAKVQDDILPQKMLAISEECVPLDVALPKDTKKPTENRVSEQIEVRHQHAVDVTETEAREASPKELKPSKIPKSVKAQRKVKESRPLLVEATSIEEAIDDLQPMKNVEQKAHGDILLSHELTEEQPQIMEAMEQLKESKSIKEETIESHFLDQEGLVITEETISETLGKEIVQSKPTTEKIYPELTSNVSLAISECQPEDSVGELKPSAEVRKETTSRTILEHKSVSTSASEVLESVDTIPLQTQPTKGIADVSLKPEEVPLVTQETETFESVAESETKPRVADTKAMQHLVLTEGLLNITADAQSPLEEQIPDFKTDEKKANLEMETQRHVVTQETVSTEEAPSDLAIEETPKSVEGTLGQSSALTIGETLETNLIEMAQDLIESQVETTKPAKETLTKAYGTAESNQESLYDTLGSVPDVEHPKGQGKVNIADAELVAEVQAAPTVIHTEEELLSVVPEFVDATMNIVEETVALEITQDTVAEKEQTFPQDVSQAEQSAVEKIIPVDLRVTTVFEVQAGQTSEDIAPADTRSVSAIKVLDTMPIGVASKPDLMEGTSYLEALPQPELKSGTVLMDETQQPLEVTNVQISETSTELADTLPKQQQTKAHPTTEDFRHAEGMEIIPMESTGQQPDEGKPTAARADVSMPQQFGTNVMEQSPLETLQPRPLDVQPQEQQTDSQFDFLPQLETSSSVTLEQETEIPLAEPHPLQSAAIGAASALQVANTERSQLMESLQGMEDLQRLPQQKAHFNIGEITLPKVEEITTLEGLQNYASPEYQKSALTNIDITETTSSLRTTTAIVSERTEELTDKDAPQEVQIQPKLNEFTQKTPLSERVNVLDQVSELSSQVPHAATGQSIITSCHEINVRQTEVLEKEELLEGVPQPSEQLVKIALDSTTGLALARQEDTFEHEEELRVLAPEAEQARPISADHLKAALTEGVMENQSTGKLEDFSASDKYASPRIDLLVETKSTETTVYDSVSKSLESMQPEILSPQQSMVPHEHKTVTECLVVDGTQPFEAKPTDQRTAVKVQDNLSHSIVLEDQRVLESEKLLGEETTPQQKANLMEDATNLHAKTVDTTAVYESMGEDRPTDKCSVQQAQVTHVLAHTHATELQQTVEAEKLLTTPEQTFAVATADGISSQLGLPISTRTQTVEDVDVLVTLPTDKRVAQSTYEGRQYEVTVSEVQGIEESENLQKSTDIAPVSAAESLDVMFKATSVDTQPGVFQKESPIEAHKPQEATAKPVVDLRQGTTTFDVLALESSERIPDTPTTAPQEAQRQLVTGVESRKVQVRLDDFIMDKEDTLPETIHEFYGKPFIEGTQRETLITQVIPMENVDQIETPQAAATFQVNPMSSERITQSHLVETQLPLELESEAIIEYEKLAQAKVKSDETNVHTTISEVNTYEITKDIKGISEQGQFIKIVEDSDINRAHVTTIQSTLLKEENLPLEPIRDGDIACVSDVKLKKKSVITEEVLGISSIQESYELQKPDEGKAQITRQAPHETVSVAEQQIYEQSPEMILEQDDRRARTKPSSVETLLKPVESSTVNVYENVEGHGEFKPISVLPSTDTTVISELKVSVVEEVSVMPSLGRVPIEKPLEGKATPESVPHKNVLQSEQLPCEVASTLLEEGAPSTEQAKLAPADTRVAAVTSVLHEKGTIRETITSTQVDEKQALPSITTQSTYLNEQTIAQENVNLLDSEEQKHIQPQNASIRIKETITSIATTEQPDLFNTTTTSSPNDTRTEERIHPTLVEDTLKNALQTTQFVSEDTSDLLLPKSMPETALPERVTHAVALSTTNESQATIYTSKDEDHTQKLLEESLTQDIFKVKMVTPRV